jgi:DNA-binding transcriptional MerR regulator
MNLTVTRLGRSCDLSRSTVLYYESIGLLTRPRRSAGNYRVYTARDMDRLRQICLYRESGLTLSDIRSLLDAPGTRNSRSPLRKSTRSTSNSSTSPLPRSRPSANGAVGRTNRPEHRRPPGKR